MSVIVINVFFVNNPVTCTESCTKSIDYAVPEQLYDIYPVTSVVMFGLLKKQTDDRVSAEPDRNHSPVNIR